MRGQKIRAITPENFVFIAAEITQCVSAYCGVGILSSAIAEAVTLVQQRFANLALSEIRLAFRYVAATPELEINLAAFGGIFSLHTLGAVLAAYSEKRKESVVSFIQKETKVLQSPVFSIEDWFDEVIQKLIELGPDATAKHIPVAPNFYAYFKRKLNITLSDEEKVNFWELARTETLRAYQRERDEETSAYKKRTIENLRLSVLKSSMCSTAREAVVATGEKLIILHHIKNLTKNETTKT